jgi:16S rRNA (uracil1498-N3)-methyltransferase
LTPLPKTRIFLELNQVVKRNYKDDGSIFFTFKDKRDSTLHHLTRVLRLKSGSELSIVDLNSSYVFTAILVYNQDLIELQVQSVNNCLNQAALEGKSLPPIVTFLAVGLAKGDVLETVCEKATELGVGGICFWQSERSVVLAEKSKITNKLERWQKIVKSAAEQSGQLFLPTLNFFTSLEELIAFLNVNAPDDLKLYCSQLNSSLTIKELKSDSLKKLSIIIGPEGDFSEKELLELSQAQFCGLSLGPHRLKVETAAIVAASFNLIEQ